MSDITSPARLELTVLDNVPFGDRVSKNVSFHALTLEFPENLNEVAPAWKNWRAGQFVMIRPSDWGNELLWARPFSIARVTSRGLVLFMQASGRGTTKLATLKNGDKVMVWGPLGNSFIIDDTKPTLLLAGGVGIAPFCGYMDQHPRRSNLHMLFGHRSNSECYPIDTIAQHIEVDVYHDKSKEDLETFLGDIKTNMQDFAKQDGLVLACGPLPFLKHVWALSHELKVKTQVSLENKMACGVGACLGCVAKTSQHWHDKSKAGLPIQTCTSGPVFWTDDIEL